MTNNEEELKQIIHRATLQLLTRYIIDEGKIIIETDKFDPRTITEMLGSNNGLRLWIDILDLKEFPIDNYLLRGKTLLGLFHGALLGYPNNEKSQQTELKEYIENTFPLNVIISEEMDFNTSMNLLKDYLEKTKEIGIGRIVPREHRKAKQITVDNVLWQKITGGVGGLGGRILDPEEELFEKWAPLDIGSVINTISIIQKLQQDGYSIRDSMIEGVALLDRLYNAANVRPGQSLEQYRETKKFISETYPLNVVAEERVAWPNIIELLREFLEGAVLRPEKEIKVIETIIIDEGYQLKELLDRILKENPNAKIGTAIRKEDIERIRKIINPITRPGIKDPEEFIIDSASIRAGITENFNIELFLYGAMMPSARESLEIERINVDNINLEELKTILGNLLEQNPNTIIGDIKIGDNVKEFKEILDIILNKNPNLLIYIDILVKDRRIMDDILRSIDLTKYKEKDIVFISNISIEISEEFFTEEELEKPVPEEKFRSMTLHLENISLL